MSNRILALALVSVSAVLPGSAQAQGLGYRDLKLGMSQDDVEGAARRVCQEVRRANTRLGTETRYKSLFRGCYGGSVPYMDVTLWDGTVNQIYVRLPGNCSDDERHVADLRRLYGAPVKVSGADQKVFFAGYQVEYHCDAAKDNKWISIVSQTLARRRAEEYR